MESFAAEDFDPDHARVLVVGPMSAGKTTLVHSLCHVGVSGGAALRKRPPPTVGCNVDVKAGNRLKIPLWDRTPVLCTNCLELKLDTWY